MTYCGEQSLSKNDGETAIIASLRCRAWTCPDCAPRRRRQLVAQAAAGKPNKFLTLTVDPAHYADPATAAAALAHAWRLIRLRAIREARRRQDRRPEPAGPAPEGGWPRGSRQRTARQVVAEPDGLQFLAVIERHKSGWPHLHILARARWIGQRWLSLQAADILKSPIVDIRLIQPGRYRYGYVAKYVGKDPARLGTTKRYWASRNYRLTPPHQKPAFPKVWARWHRLDQTYGDLLLHMVIHRWKFETITPTLSIGRRSPPKPTPGEQPGPPPRRQR